jgi:hypothetical protein
VALLGAFVSILGGLFLSYLAKDEERERLRTRTRAVVPALSLASDRELYQQERELSLGLRGVARQPDPSIRQVALLKLTSVARQIDALAGGAGRLRPDRSLAQRREGTAPLPEPAGVQVSRLRRVGRRRA